MEAAKVDSTLVQACKHINSLRNPSSVREFASAVVRIVHDCVPIVRALRACPSVNLRLSGSPEGAEIRRALATRRHKVGIPDRLAAGVLRLPEPLEVYLRGSEKQAFRTNSARARKAGVICRRPTWDELPDAIPRLLRARQDSDSYHAWLLKRVRQRQGRFWACFAEDGEPLALAVFTVDGAVAYLAWLISNPVAPAGGDSRYLLSSHAFMELGREGVHTIVTKSVLFLPPGVLYFQRLLGFRPANLKLEIVEGCGSSAVT